MNSLPISLAVSGTLYLASTLMLAITQTPLGTPLFLASGGAATAAYLILLRGFWRETAPRRGAFMAALVMSVAIRAPLVGPRPNSDSDMVRYLWDGRVQTMGSSPYEVTQADPG